MIDALIALLMLTSQSQINPQGPATPASAARKGSSRVGGHGSSGKGGRYIGGKTRSGKASAKPKSAATKKK